MTEPINSGRGALPCPSRWCGHCAASTNRRECSCGARTLPLLDRRPVLLSPALEHAVEKAARKARLEAGTASGSRATLLRRHVIPHFLAVLREHRVAAYRKRHGGCGYRVLEGDLGAQIRFVSRIAALHRATLPSP